MKSTGFVHISQFHHEVGFENSFLNGFQSEELEAGGPSVDLGQLGGAIQATHPHPPPRMGLPPAPGPATPPFKPQIFAFLTSAERGTES